MPREISEVYNRTSELKLRLNSFLRELTGSSTDHLDSLTQNQLISSKSSLSDINNILTLKLSRSCVQWMQDYFSINQSEAETLNHVIDATKPNTNGYDIDFTGQKKIVAEIKCIVPINGGNDYGPAQKNAILDDAIKLIKGKKKTPNTSSYIKIIGLIDLAEKTDEAIRKLCIPTQNVRTTQLFRLDRHQVVHKLKVITDDTTPDMLTTEFVYIKKLKI